MCYRSSDRNIKFVLSYFKWNKNSSLHKNQIRKFNTKIKDLFWGEFFKSLELNLNRVWFIHKTKWTISLYLYLSRLISLEVIENEHWNIVSEMPRGKRTTCRTSLINKNHICLFSYRIFYCPLLKNYWKFIVELWNQIIYRVFYWKEKTNDIEIALTLDIL